MKKEMKKLLAIVTVLAILVSCFDPFCVSASGTPTIVLAPKELAQSPDGLFTVGEIFAYDVKMRNITSFYGLQVTVYFDSTKLKLVDASGVASEATNDVTLKRNISGTNLDYIDYQSDNGNLTQGGLAECTLIISGENPEIAVDSGEDFFVGGFRFKAIAPGNPNVQLATGSASKKNDANLGGYIFIEKRAKDGDDFDFIDTACAVEVTGMNIGSAVPSGDAAVVSPTGVYAVAGSAPYTITDGTAAITDGMSVAEFLNNLAKHAEADWMVVPDGTTMGIAADFNGATGKAETVAMANNDILAVLAEDGTTLRKYTVTVGVKASDDATVKALGTNYSVNDTAGTIVSNASKITTATKVQDFLDKLTKCVQADWKVIPYSVIISSTTDYDEATGKLASENMTVGDQLAVKDGAAWKVYKATVLSSDAFVASDKYAVVTDGSGNTIAGTANTSITTVTSVTALQGNLKKHEQANWKVIPAGVTVNNTNFNSPPSEKTGNDLLADDDQLAVLAEDGETLMIYKVKTTPPNSNTEVLSSSYIITTGATNTIAEGAPTGPTAITDKTAVSTFLSRLTMPSGADWKVVASGAAITTKAEFDAAAAKIASDAVSMATGDRLVILAEDRQTVREYSINVGVGSNSNAAVYTIGSRYEVVSGSPGSIAGNDVPITTTTKISEFLGNMTKDVGAGWKVVPRGTTMSIAADFSCTATLLVEKGQDDTMSAGDLLAVLAGDGVTLKVYIVDVETGTVVVNKTALTAAINAEYSDGSSRTMYSLTEAAYTAASWTAYVNAIDAAETVEADSDATQVQVNAATEAIAAAKEALVLDIMPPEADLLTPEVGTRTQLVVSFNEKLHADTYNINDIAELLSGATNNAGTIPISNTPNSIVWDKSNENAPKAILVIPPTTFAAGNTVVLNFVANAVKDAAGNVLTDLTESDTVVSDQTPPVASIRTPIRGAAQLVVTFNERLQTSTTNTTNIAGLLSSITYDVDGENRTIPLNDPALDSSIVWNTSNIYMPKVTISIPQTVFEVGKKIRINFASGVVKDTVGKVIDPATSFEATIENSDLTSNVYIIDPVSLTIKNLNSFAQTSLTTFTDNLIVADGGTITVRKYRAVYNNAGSAVKVDVAFEGKLPKTYTVILYGDVNGDGLVNGQDALALKKHVTAGQTPKISDADLLNAANATKDAAVNGNDALAVKKHVSPGVLPKIKQH